MAEHKPTERERAMVAAYREGDKVTDIEQRFGVGRSTLYHVLRRSGVTPARSHRQVTAASGDARLAGLAELILHQDKLILELQASNKRLTRQVASLQSKLGANDGHSRNRKQSAS